MPVAGCYRHDDLTLLYTGISPRNTSSSATLRKRINNFHYSGNASSSTLRKTLGCLLAAQLGIKLRQFERQRKSETVLATHLFGSLKWIYGTDNVTLSRLRNFGMQLVQDNAWCRRRLMQQAIRNMA